MEGLAGCRVAAGVGGAGEGLIFKARSRLGRGPLELSSRRSRGRRDGGDARRVLSPWRLMSLDGTCLDVEDTPANEQQSGGQGRSWTGLGAFPQLRLLALSETGTHAICAAAMGC